VVDTPLAFTVPYTVASDKPIADATPVAAVGGEGDWPITKPDTIKNTVKIYWKNNRLLFVLVIVNSL
jgi:hypothetical protein